MDREQTMIISFDLDDTLIPGTKTFETEDQNLIQKLTGIERIRKVYNYAGRTIWNCIQDGCKERRCRFKCGTS